MEVGMVRACARSLRNLIRAGEPPARVPRNRRLSYRSRGLGPMFGSFFRPLVHDVGAITAEVKIVRWGVEVFEEAAALAVAGFFDVALQLAQEAFFVSHRRLSHIQNGDPQIQTRTNAVPRSSRSCTSRRA